MYIYSNIQIYKSIYIYHVHIQIINMYGRFYIYRYVYACHTVHTYMYVLTHTCTLSYMRAKTYIYETGEISNEEREKD
jgi:hypothetical protein